MCELMFEAWRRLAAEEMNAAAAWVRGTDLCLQNLSSQS